MKLLLTRSMFMTAVLATMALTGCATSSSPQHGSMESMNMSNSNRMAMCKDMHPQMDAKTLQERQAMMAEHMKSMPPEMRQHCQMMMQDQQGGQSIK